MEIYEDEWTPQSKRKKIDPIEEAKELAIKEIQNEVSKEIGEIEQPTVLLDKTPTRMIPYSSLEFTFPLIPNP